MTKNKLWITLGITLYKLKCNQINEKIKQPKKPNKNNKIQKNRNKKINKV